MVCLQSNGVFAFVEMVPTDSVNWLPPRIRDRWPQCPARMRTIQQMPHRLASTTSVFQVEHSNNNNNNNKQRIAKILYTQTHNLDSCVYVCMYVYIYISVYSMETWLEARKIVAFINSQHEMWQWQTYN